MAKNNKRAEHMGKSDRNVNRALLLLAVGIVAEFYLLMVNNYYVKGGVGQVLTMMKVLEVLSYVGTALFGAGVVFWIMREKWTRFAPWTVWLLAAGFFFAVSSRLMLAVYPQGTKAMCVLVPVAMLLGVVFLLYPREFSVEALALTAALMALYLIYRGGGSESWAGVVRGCGVFAACTVLALLAAVYKAGGNGGKLGALRLVSAGADYAIVYAVLGVCLAAIVAALFIGSIAYYGLWALAIGTFLLAVYYTIKVM